MTTREDTKGLINKYREIETECKELSGHHGIKLSRAKEATESMQEMKYHIIK